MFFKVTWVTPLFWYITKHFPIQRFHVTSWHHVNRVTCHLMYSCAHSVLSIKLNCMCLKWLQKPQLTGNFVVYYYSPYNRAEPEMVMCAIIGCSKRTERDKDVKFYQISTIWTSRPDPQEVELGIKRRQGCIAAISRPELSTTELEEARICFRHFIFGKPAALFEECYPDWLSKSIPWSFYPWRQHNLVHYWEVWMEKSKRSC